MNGAPLDTLLFAMRSLHFAATISTAGLVVFRQAVVASSFADATFERTLRRIFAWGIVILVASGIGWFAVTTAAIADEPIKDIFAGPLASEVLLDTQFGQVSLMRLAVAIALSICVLKREDRWVSVTLATILLASIAWLGHSGAAPSVFFTAADALHVTAAGAWLGGLVPLALLLAALRRQKDAKSVSIGTTVTRRFSLLGVTMVTSHFDHGPDQHVELGGQRRRLTRYGLWAPPTREDHSLPRDGLYRRYQSVPIVAQPACPGYAQAA